MNAPLPSFLSPVALEIGQREVCSDMTEIGDFIAGADHIDEPCAYFGPISTPRLVSEILLNQYANDKQLAAAARELRRRLLQEKETLVLERAERAMQ